MKKAALATSILIFLSAILTGSAEDNQNPAGTDTTLWGKVVNGLQLGISPTVGTNHTANAVFDGNTLNVNVHLRNVSTSPVRFIASVHTCLLGGANPLLVSKLILKPDAGEEPLVVTYQGWNHLSLLDKRRAKSEQPQQTLNDSCGGKTDIQLSAEDAQNMTTVLAPGKTARAEPVAFVPGKDSGCWWQLEKKPNIVPAGKYRVTAVLVVDQELSEWKGELTSGTLEAEIRPQVKE